MRAHTCGMRAHTCDMRAHTCVCPDYTPGDTEPNGDHDANTGVHG